MFSVRFCSLLFFQCAFDQSDQSTREFINKSINCEQTSLPLKERNIFYYKVDLYFDALCFNDFNLYFSFGFVQLTVDVKLVALQPYDRKYFSMKTANAHAFSKPVTANKNPCQSSAAPQNLGRKLQTVYITPWYTSSMQQNFS